jgi:lipoprotein-anchoring transpeptidase ErfK/SrfK
VGSLVASRRLIVAVPLCLLFVGCSPTVSMTTSEPSAVSQATIAAQPVTGAPIKPSDPVVVTASNGHLSEVVVSGPDGVLDGRLSADGSQWIAVPGELGYGTTYRIQATAMDSRGVVTTATHQFSTIEPQEFFAGQVTPVEGSTVGVGMPITVTFDRAIKDKAAVERAMTIRTPTSIEGAWSWESNRIVEFRPRDYWPGNIEVTVDLGLQGVEAAPGVFGRKDTSTTFSFGPAMVTKVDSLTYKADVYRDGELLRTLPITTGKPGFETRSGIKVILSKERSRIMDAASGGTSRTDAEYYRVLAEYAMRITPSGEFLHAAPWSVGYQGRANVSHGCVGMSTSNAQWLYEQTTVGDVVEVTGTSRPQNLGNGITIWNEGWQDWLAASASGAVWTNAGEGAATAVADPSVSSSTPTASDALPIPIPSQLLPGSDSSSRRPSA